MIKYIPIFILIFPSIIFGQEDKVAPSNLFNSLYGTTGTILISNAYTVGKFKGNVGVF